MLLWAFATILVVLWLCRGLVFGAGGYQLYIDSALPASNSLLRGVCNQSLTLWSSANSGERVLYPGEYLACAAVVGFLDVGIPSWLISRFLPIVAMCVAALGMFRLVLVLHARLRADYYEQPAPSVSFGAAAAAAVLYACSPYSFTELVAGHFLYLISLAVFPWIASIIIDWRHDSGAIFVAGLLLAVCFVQVQFILLGPAMLVLMAFLIGSYRSAIRSVLSSLLGLLCHLPWIAPLVAYPPSVNLAAYLVPGTDARLSVGPIESLRLIGYITPFAETAVKSWYLWWDFLSIGALFFALVGILRLEPRKAGGLVAAVVVTVIYQWGAYAPGYSIWSRVVPSPVTALLRERYSLSFITLVALSIGVFVGLQTPRWITRTSVRVRRRKSLNGLRYLAAGGGILATLGVVGPFLDGHLGPYGLVREQFSTAAAVTQYIDAHGGGTVLTVPFGSIVKGRNWPLYGRSPFTLGGPANVLDSEGAPGAPALPLVVALATSLDEPVNTDPDIAAEYMRLLNVTYVVDWTTLTGDVPLDRTTVMDHLMRLGVRSVWSNSEATVYRVVGITPMPAVELSRGLYVVSAPYPGAFKESQRWHVPLTVAASGTAKDAFAGARVSNGLVQLAERSVVTVRNGSALSVMEPVFVPQAVGLQQGTLNHRIESTGGGVLAFSDGTVVPDGTNSVDVLGPVDNVYPARVDALIRGTSLISAVPNIEDTHNSHGLSLTQAGISATVVRSPGGGQSVTVSARQDEAGLPIPLQLVRNASYSISFTSQGSDQSTGSVRIFSNDATRMVLQKGLPTDRSQHIVTLHFTAPIDASNLWLYLYVEGSDRSTPAAFTFSQLSGTVSETLASQPAATEQAVGLTAGPNVLHPSDQDSLVQDMVIAPKPQSCASGNMCAQIPRLSSGLWLVDRHSADGWWQLDAPGASRSKLSANGIGAVWYLSHAQVDQLPSLTYLPETLFTSLLRYVAAILILIGTACLMPLVPKRMRSRLTRLARARIARIASVRLDREKHT